MPIYEYTCENCGKTDTWLICRSVEEITLRCRYCRSSYLKRIMSGFTIHKTEARRVDEIDTQKPQDDSFFKDFRNVGIWAKKRARELGMDLGEQFNSKLEKARTGEINPKHTETKDISSCYP